MSISRLPFCSMETVDVASKAISHARSALQTMHCQLLHHTMKNQVTEIVFSAAVKQKVTSWHLKARCCLTNWILWSVIRMTNQCLPSVLWQCWLGIRKSIQPVKNWVTRCRHRYLFEARCKYFAYDPADANATPSSLASLKSRSD